MSLAIAASAASLVLGFGLNAAGTVITGGLSAAPGHRAQWQMWAGIIVAAVIYLATLIAWWGKNAMLRRNGTAFVVKERARDWDLDEPADFYAQVGRRFARVITVPGPEALGSGWDWPLDADARHWEERLAQLVRSFQTVYIAQQADRRNELGATGIFVTAYAPVALALGYRLQSGDRQLGLDVWQRPSHGGAGKIEPDIWSQRGHRFGESLAAAALATEERVWDAELTVDRTGAAIGHDVAGGGPVSTLLVRYGRGPWGGAEGGLPATGAEPLDLEPVPVTLHDMAGAIPRRGTFPVQLHELRCTPSGRAFAWDDFPFLVEKAVTWIQAKTAELHGHTLLLGTAMPNEVALGIGLTAGRESCVGWPKTLWPVVYRKPAETLIVPRLDLGSNGVRAR